MTFKIPSSIVIDYFEVFDEREKSVFLILRHAAILHLLALHQLNKVLCRYNDVFNMSKYHSCFLKVAPFLEAIEQFPKETGMISTVLSIMKSKHEGIKPLHIVVEECLGMVEDVDSLFLDHDCPEVIKGISDHLDMISGTVYEHGFPKGLTQTCDRVLNSLNEVEGMLYTLADLEEDLEFEDFIDLEQENRRLFKLVRQCDFLLTTHLKIGYYDDLKLFKTKDEISLNYKDKYREFREISFKITFQLVKVLRYLSGFFTSALTIAHEHSEEILESTNNVLASFFLANLALLKHHDYVEDPPNDTPELCIRRTIEAFQAVKQSLDEYHENFGFFHQRTAPKDENSIETFIKALGPPMIRISKIIETKDPIALFSRKNIIPELKAFLSSLDGATSSFIKDRARIPNELKFNKIKK